MIRSNKKYIYSLMLKFFSVDIILISFFYFYLFELETVIQNQFLQYLRVLYWILVILLILISLTYPYIAYQNNQYSVDYKHILVKKGVFILKEEYVLTKNIQYIEINKNPFDRILQICTIVIYTSGSEITLNGLIYEDALVIKNKLEKIIGESHENI